MKHTIEELSLANGAKGLLIDVPDATVLNMQLNFRAGYYLVDDKLKWEVPHILEHLIGANKKYPSSRLFDAELEKNGAYYNAATNSYSISYILECADFEWQRVFELLMLALEQPVFHDKELQAEKGNVTDELTADLNNNFRQLVLAAREKFGFLVMPDAQRIPALESATIKDISDHYKRTHHSDNLRFVIAGQVKKRRDEIVKRLEATSLKRGERFALPDETPNTFNGPLYVDKVGVENIYFLVDTFAKHTLEPSEEDALKLLNVMLTATLHSRIFGTAREQGLVYHMSSNFNQLKQTSNWWFGAQIRQKNSGALFELISSELKKVLKGDISNDDIEAARQYSLGRYQRSVQTVGGLLNGYAHQYFFDERIDDYFAIPNRINAVTKEKMVAVAQRMFDESLWGLSVLGSDQQAVADDLHERIAPLWS